MWQSECDEYHGSHVAFNNLSGESRGNELEKGAAGGMQEEEQFSQDTQDVTQKTPRHVRSPPSYWLVSYSCGGVLHYP